MTPGDKAIVEVLNLLSMLFSARRKQLPPLTEEAQHKLIVTKEHLEGANISIPTFCNTLKVFNDKGYLVGVVVYEKQYHDGIRNFFKDDNYSQTIQKLKDAGIYQLSNDQKKNLADAAGQLVPSYLQFDKNTFVAESITYEDLLQGTKELLAEHEDDDIGLVVLSPFRSIDRLLKKMNDGHSFDSIQDTEIWYDPENYIFHINSKAIHTSYQNKPNIEHSILALLPEYLDDGVIDFDVVTEHTPKSLYSNLKKFIGKHEGLSKVFKVYKDRLEFDKVAFK